LPLDVLENQRLANDDLISRFFRRIEYQNFLPLSEINHGK